MDSRCEAERKNAVVFETGGKRPDKENDGNWIGRIGWCLEGEGLPLDVDGEEMAPLAMFSRSSLPWMPASLDGIDVLAVFLSPGFWDHLADDDYDGLFSIREYGSKARRLPCEWNNDCIKPFPLTPSLIEDSEDDGEEESDCEDEDDDDPRYSHKLGGFPTFIQGEPYFGDDYDFIFQIASDDKAELNIVDMGCFYFFRNRRTGEWKMHCDFF